MGWLDMTGVCKGMLGCYAKWHGGMCLIRGACFFPPPPYLRLDLNPTGHSHFQCGGRHVEKKRRWCHWWAPIENGTGPFACRLFWFSA